MKPAIQLDVHAALTPVRRRMGLRRLERGACTGLGIGAIAGAFLLLCSYLRLLPDSRATAFGLAAAGAMAGVLTGLRHWPRPFEAARTVDHHFALQDRMTTALELRSEQDALAQLQRRDVAALLPQLKLADSVGHANLTLTQVSAAAALALLAMAALWHPPASLHPQTVAAADDRTRIRHAAQSSLPQITKKLEAGLTAQQLHSASFRQLLESLVRLRRQLLHTSSRSAALRAISSLEQQLQRNAASMHSVSREAATQLDASLKAYSAAGQAATRQSTSGPVGEAARTLSQLANTSSHLSRAQRGRLARALERAGNSVSDAQLRADLQRAAASLANSDTRSAQMSLRHAASLLQHSSSARTERGRIGQTNSRLDTLKSAISGLQAPLPRSAGGARAGSPVQAGRSAGSTPYSPQEPSGAPQGHQTGSGAGSKTSSPASGFTRGQAGRIAQGNGAGKSGPTPPGTSGSSAGQGGQHARGIGNALGNGGGGTGGHGSGGGQGDQGPRGSGKFVTVYLSGQQGTGPQTTRRGGFSAPRQSIRVPYHAVLGRYASSAHAALDHSSLPPSLRSYVRRYFSAISR